MTERVRELYRAGMSAPGIAARLGISRQLVAVMLRAAPKPVRPIAEVVAEVEHLVGYRYDLADVLGYANDATLSRTMYRAGRPDLAAAVVHHCRPGAAELRSAA